MAFMVVQKRRRFSSDIETGDDVIRMSLIAPSGSHKQGIILYLGGDILRALGIDIDREDLPRNERSIAVYEGTHNDAGSWMLKKSTDGYAVTYNKSIYCMGATQITCAALQHYKPTQEQADPQSLQYVIDEKECTVLVQMPIWLQYDSFTVPSNKVVEPEPQTATVTQFVHRKKKQMRK